MNFLKMEGLGNDFIVTHEISENDVNSLKDKASKICDRRRGIGADGIIFVLPSQNADFRMRIFNSDGSEPEMCGNGIRCFALYIKLLNLSKLDKLNISTLAGIISTQLLDNNNVTVNMGKPVLNGPDIPVSGSGKIIMKDLSVGDKTFKINAVSMGNPHAVIYPDSDLSDELVLGYGPQIEKHPYFPKKTNVEFIKVLSSKEIQMRVWERGCGETQACGTGACASAVAGIINGLHDTNVIVHLPGGDLNISWSGKERDSVFMSGPARKVFQGTIDL